MLYSIVFIFVFFNFFSHFSPHTGTPNPLYFYENSNFALISPDHIRGWTLGQTYAYNQIVYVTPADPTEKLRTYEKEKRTPTKNKNSQNGNSNENGLSEDTEKSGHENNESENRKNGRGSKNKKNNNYRNIPKRDIGSTPPPPIPYLWGAGRMGGRARVVKWGPCGARGSKQSWHGDRYRTVCGVVWCVLCSVV